MGCLAKRADFIEGVVEEHVELTARTIAKLLTPRMFAGFRLHYGKGINTNFSIPEEATHNSDEIFVLHLFDGNIVYKAGNDSPRTCFFADVNLFDVQTIGVGMFLDCADMSTKRKIEVLDTHRQ